MASRRRPIYFNTAARSWTAEPVTSPNSIDEFHRKLDGFKPSRLVRLDGVAKELGVQSVYLKDESCRLGLPSFKILGASWGTFRAITSRLGFPLDTSIRDIACAAAASGIRLFAATDGNHGRAVAWMGRLLSIPVEIYVPAGMRPDTAEFIRSEGAEVVATDLSYDDAMKEAQRAAARQSGGLLIQDCAVDGYEEIPQWIVDGYSTVMREIDTQLGDERANLVIAPVGVGSLAQSVITHCKAGMSSSRPAVLAVEPDTAACLWKSLSLGKRVSEQTTPTIMAGLDCGTISAGSWPLLKFGIDASLTVSDYESHRAVQELETLGVSAGPCGASSLAALRRLDASDKAALGLSSESVVVLLCTEGARDYDIPLDSAVGGAISLTKTLVSINSASPTLGSVPGPGETGIARYIKSWLEHRNIEAHYIEPVKGRPSVVGIVRGSGGGRSLMLNGHIDTVSTTGYKGDPFSGDIREGHKVFGRGSADMKGGVAAAMLALAGARELHLSGDVIFTGVADEEDKSIGTEHVLAAGWRADGAVVSEPTNLDLVSSHKGFIWFEVDVYGTAAHGSRPDLGLDAIAKAGYFLVELDLYSRRLQGQEKQDGSPGPRPSVHASLIQGGEESSSYPATCTVTIERRTVLGETVETVQQEIQGLLEKVAEEVPDFTFALRATFNRPSFNISPKHPFATLAKQVVGQALGEDVVFHSQAYWADTALLAEAGIPALLWGPRGEGLHAEEEWVDAQSVEQVAGALTELARQFCC